MACDYHEACISARADPSRPHLMPHGHFEPSLPFELSPPAGFAYYGVYPQRALQRSGTKAFRDWLMAEAR